MAFLKRHPWHKLKSWCTGGDFGVASQTELTLGFSSVAQTIGLVFHSFSLTLYKSTSNKMPEHVTHQNRDKAGFY